MQIKWDDLVLHHALTQWEVGTNNKGTISNRLIRRGHPKKKIMACFLTDGKLPTSKLSSGLIESFEPKSSPSFMQACSEIGPRSGSS